MNSVEFEFSKGFENLHTLSYQNILKNEGFGLNEAKNSLNVVAEIRNKKISKMNKNKSHPMLKKILNE